MISIGIINFGLNEIFITKTNRIQDTLRNQIRSRNKIINQTSKVWKAGDNRIYSFRKKSASDNAIAAVKDLEIFEFNKDNTDLISYSKVSSARWERGEIRFLDKVKKIIWKEGIGRRIDDNSYSVNVSSNPFQSDISNPNHLNISETKLRIVQSNSIKEKRIYQISLQKKYSIPFIPLIIMLFSVPFALSIGRQRNVITIGYAIGIWLLFMGITNIFEQFGQSGFLSPTLAIWSPLVLFSIAGLYLLTKVRT
jgi:lipopolysaccharide export LptBFGC system permease protein LptF